MQSTSLGCTTIKPDGVWMQEVTGSRNGNSSAVLKASFGFPVTTSGPPLKFTTVPVGPQTRWKCQAVGRKPCGGGLLEPLIGAGINVSSPGYTTPPIVCAVSGK